MLKINTEILQSLKVSNHIAECKLGILINKQTWCSFLGKNKHFHLSIMILHFQLFKNKEHGGWEKWSYTFLSHWICFFTVNWVFGFLVFHQYFTNSHIPHEFWQGLCREYWRTGRRGYGELISFSSYVFSS